MPIHIQSSHTNIAVVPHRNESGGLIAKKSRLETACIKIRMPLIAEKQAVVVGDDFDITVINNAARLSDQSQ